MENDLVIDLRDVAKSYSLESQPWRRLWQQFSGRPSGARQHDALHRIDLQVRRGEVVGIIGRNGAGKSTLLQIVCGVLQPSRGTRNVRGRVAALLELGAGFNTELTGRENVRLNGPLLGLSAAEVNRRMDDIVDFAGIGAFVDQPVRSYSSGMFMRLAFSMATSMDPEILVVDEALSVGDGAFARKSYERIMALKEQGTTILFCSHSMFTVESLCHRALWIEGGTVRFDGPAHQATVEYSEWLSRHEQGKSDLPAQAQHFQSESAAIEHVTVRSPAHGGSFRSGVDPLLIDVAYRSDPQIPAPTLGVVIQGADGRAVTSAGNWLDGVTLPRSAAGHVSTTLEFPALPLLKGRYTVSAYVLCHRGINVYASGEHVAALEVVQDHVEQGVVSLPHRWHGAA
ncbi:MAG: ABC transporter ATP-binding protein [Pseudomonadota bacterium]|nr:ABC transporter ATP-binding protein [Pseudomonadota bacterium]